MAKFVDTPWTAIVSRDEFDQVQALLRSRQVGRYSRAENRILSKKCFCSCGRVLWTRKNNHAHALVCSGSDDKSCKELFAMVPVERVMLEQLREILLEGDRIEERFAQAVKEEAEMRAETRAETKEVLRAQLASAQEALDDKLYAPVPRHPEVRAEWDRMLEHLTEQKLALEKELARAMAPVPITSVTGARIGDLRKQMNKLIAQVPLTGDSELHIRTRGVIGSILKRVRLERVNETDVAVAFSFDFGDELGLEKSVGIERRATIYSPMFYKRENEEMYEGLATGRFMPTEEQFRALEVHPLVARAFRSASRLERRRTIIHMLFIAASTKGSLTKICEALGEPRYSISTTMDAFKKPEDAEAVSALLAELRPDLPIDAARFRKNPGFDELTYRARFAAVNHPLLRHPLASTAPGRARLSDDEFEVVVGGFPEDSYFFDRKEMFRKRLDCLLWLLRSNGSLKGVPSDIYSRALTTQHYDMLRGREIVLATKALLVHAGLAKPRDKLIVPEVERHPWRQRT